MTDAEDDALECAGIQAVTRETELMLGDLSNWRPTGLLNLGSDAVIIVDRQGSKYLD